MSRQIQSNELLPVGTVVKVHSLIGTVVSAKMAKAYPSGQVCLHKIKFTHRMKRRAGNLPPVRQNLLKPIVSSSNYAFIYTDL